MLSLGFLGGEGPGRAYLSGENAVRCRVPGVANDLRGVAVVGDDVTRQTGVGVSEVHAVAFVSVTAAVAEGVLTEACPSTNEHQKTEKGSYQSNAKTFPTFLFNSRVS